MAFVLYLAMTAAEFHTDSPLPCPTAWMACHFSPYGTALSNLPSALPKGSLLILNDRTPVFGHNPERIAQQLAETAEQFECSGILLDFQRPDEERTGSIAEAIAALPYPVAVTPQYAEKLDCAVFLPPPPMTTPLKTHLAPWQGRKIWLEAAMEKQCVRVDKTGSKALPWDGDPLPCPHTDEALHCTYRIEVHSDHIDFFLRRDEAQLRALLEEGEQLGISRFVGLYQQLGASFAQEMAADTARFHS